jgi:hypothetical protein
MPTRLIVNGFLKDFLEKEDSYLTETWPLYLDELIYQYIKEGKDSLCHSRVALA